MGHSIAEAGARRGCSIDTPRCYEKILPLDSPTRLGGRRRTSSDADLEWLDLWSLLRAVELSAGQSSADDKIEEYDHRATATAR